MTTNKHIKLYEELFKRSIPPTPEVGDYVLADNVNFGDEDKRIYDFIKSNIGHIINKVSGDEDGDFIVEYDISNTSEDVKEVIEEIVDSEDFDYDNQICYFYLYTSEIEYWSSIKSEVEILIQSRKYNL